MRTSLLAFLLFTPILFVGCAAPAKIQYQLIESPDPSLRVIRLFQNSRIGSSRTGSSTGFFFNPTHVVKDGRNFKTVDELLTFLTTAKQEHSIDALVIMVMVGPIQMYSASDIQLRNEAITSCSEIGMKVLVQEIGGNGDRYFLAKPASSQPNP